MSLIFLIGMPYAGKTYWAQQLSQRYNIPAVDMDALIEEQTGKSISQIFEEEGEDSFRIKEQALLHDIIENHPRPLIISCGGGTPVFFNNMELMKQAGCVLYLSASIETLTARFEGTEEANNRPLLASVADIETQLSDLLERRKYIYEQAHHKLSSDSLSISNFEHIISLCIDRH